MVHEFEELEYKRKSSLLSNQPTTSNRTAHSPPNSHDPHNNKAAHQNPMTQRSVGILKGGKSAVFTINP